MALKPLIGHFAVEPWDTVEFDVEMSRPAINFYSPPWPACPACGNAVTCITLGKNVPLSDTMQTFTIAAVKCSCGLKLHALPH